MYWILVLDPTKLTAEQLSSYRTEKRTMRISGLDRSVVLINVTNSISVVNVISELSTSGVPVTNLLNRFKEHYDVDDPFSRCPVCKHD